MQKKSFKIKLGCLSALIERINKSNIIYQTQNLEIQHLQKEMYGCLRHFIELVCKPRNFNEDLTKLKSIGWTKKLNLKEDLRIIDNNLVKFLTDKEFLKKLTNSASKDVKEILSSHANDQLDFIHIFMPYIGKMIELMYIYMPYDDPVVKSIDFVEINIADENFEEKILTLNEQFAIISPEEIVELTAEILQLKMDASNVVLAKSESNSSSLLAWNKIENMSFDIDHHQKYKLLSKIIRTIHTLPTSSSGVEQAFSQVKLVKNLLRSRLSEKLTEALMVIAQEYQDCDDISVSDDMIKRFDKIRHDLADRKSGNRESVQNNANMNAEDVEEEEDISVYDNSEESNENTSDSGNNHLYYEEFGDLDDFHYHEKYVENEKYLASLGRPEIDVIDSVNIGIGGQMPLFSSTFGINTPNSPENNSY